MKTPVLVFRLSGAMASWGEVTTGELRSSLAHPTRSALLGLLGAALGIRRGEIDRLEELRRSLRFAVAVLDAGDVLMDFHTTERHAAKRGERLPTRAAEIDHIEHRDNPNVSRRWYRCDVDYLVASWRHREKEGPELDALAQALERPEFTLFLGRKSCPPGAPLRPKVIETEGLERALSELAACWPDDTNGLRLEGDARHLSLYFDEHDGDTTVPESFFPETLERVQRRDLPRAGFRAFAARTECRGTLTVPEAR